MSDPEAQPRYYQRKLTVEALRFMIDERIRLYKLPYAQRVHDLRRAFNLGQEQLARLLGVSWVTVSRWENAKHRPTPATMRCIAVLEDAKVDDALRHLVTSGRLHDPLMVLSVVLSETLGRPPDQP